MIEKAGQAESKKKEIRKKMEMIEKLDKKTKKGN